MPFHKRVRRVKGFTDSLRLPAQFAGEETEISRTCIGGIFDAVAGFVVGVLKGVASIRVDLHIDGYLPKTTTIAGFLAAVRLIGEGGQVIAASPTPTTTDPTATLTAREAEVLQLLASGSTNAG